MAPKTKCKGTQGRTQGVYAYVPEPRVSTWQVHLVPFVKRADQNAPEEAYRHHPTTALAARVTHRYRQDCERHGMHHLAPWPGKKTYRNRLCATDIQPQWYAGGQ